MRVVLDTNAIIAAFASRGLCAEVFEVSVSDHRIIISEHIFSEVETNLLRKIKLPLPRVREVVDYLKDVTEIVVPDTIGMSACRDSSDLPVLGTAMKGRAACIITGDADLLVLKKYKDVEIITPREFWTRLR